MDITVNATGSSVKVDYPDLSTFRDYEEILAEMMEGIDYEEILAETVIEVPAVNLTGLS